MGFLRAARTVLWWAFCVVLALAAIEGANEHAGRWVAAGTIGALWCLRRIMRAQQAEYAKLEEIRELLRRIAANQRKPE